MAKKKKKEDETQAVFFCPSTTTATLGTSQCVLSGGKDIRLSLHW